MKAWETEKGRAAKTAAKALQKQRQRQCFYRWELVPYLAVNTSLLLLNFSLAGAIAWAIYPLLGWGLGLGLGSPWRARKQGGFCQKGYARKTVLLDEVV